MNKVCREQFVALHKMPLVSESVNRQWIFEWSQTTKWHCIGGFSCDTVWSLLRLVSSTRLRWKTVYSACRCIILYQQKKAGLITNIISCSFRSLKKKKCFQDLKIVIFNRLLEEEKNFYMTFNSRTWWFATHFVCRCSTQLKTKYLPLVGRNQKERERFEQIFTPTTEQGNLDLNKVLESTYFFSWRVVLASELMFSGPGKETYNRTPGGRRLLFAYALFCAHPFLFYNLIPAFRYSLTPLLISSQPCRGSYFFDFFLLFSCY